MIKPQKVPASGIVGQEPADDTVDVGVFEEVPDDVELEVCPLSTPRLALFGAVATEVTAAPPTDEAEAAL